MGVKIKRTTWGEIKKRYLTGFKAMKYGVNHYYKTTYGPNNILCGLSHEFYLVPIYIKRQDVTYIAITDLGYLDCFGPFDGDDTIVLRYPGKISDIESLKEDETLNAAFNELYNKKEEKIKDRKEES